MLVTDSTPMFFGIHHGKPMKDVPDGYLRWLFYRGRKSCPPELLPYITARLKPNTAG